MSGAQINVAFFGDSICFGQGVSVHKGWVTRISKKLDTIATENGSPVYVFNSSVNGDTTLMALDRMAHDIQNQYCDVVLIQFGINDCNYWESDNGVPRVSPRSFEANTREIISRAKASGARQIMLSTNHPVPRTDIFKHTSISLRQSNEEYNKILREVADSESATLIDNENVWLEKIESDNLELADLLLVDQVHLSELGHDLYFETALPFMESALKNITP